MLKFQLCKFLFEPNDGDDIDLQMKLDYRSSTFFRNYINISMIYAFYVYTVIRYLKVSRSFGIILEYSISFYIYTFYVTLCFVEGAVVTGLQVINDLINQNVKGKCIAHKK